MQRNEKKKKSLYAQGAGRVSLFPWSRASSGEFFAISLRYHMDRMLITADKPGNSKTKPEQVKERSFKG